MTRAAASIEPRRFGARPVTIVGQAALMVIGGAAIAWAFVEGAAPPAWRNLLALFELLVALRLVQIAYTDASVDEDGLTIRALFGHRTLPWHACAAAHVMPWALPRGTVGLGGIGALALSLAAGSAVGALGADEPTTFATLFLALAGPYSALALLEDLAPAVRRLQTPPSLFLTRIDGARPFIVPRHLAAAGKDAWHDLLTRAGVAIVVHDGERGVAEPETWRALRSEVPPSAASSAAERPDEGA